MLEAAHIKPYSLVGRHELTNGLLLRSDIHILFDKGYLTVDPTDSRIAVSERIREEFENGRDYYKLDGQTLREPNEPWARPSSENLEYHAYNVFRQRPPLIPIFWRKPGGGGPCGRVENAQVIDFLNPLTPQNPLFPPCHAPQCPPLAHPKYWGT